jgi:hypothetical protein
MKEIIRRDSVEGRRKKEEGRRKKEEGRRKKEPRVPALPLRFSKRTTWSLLLQLRGTC